MKTHEGKMWDCSYCGKKFTTKYFLKKHRRLHTGRLNINSSSLSYNSFPIQARPHILATFVGKPLRSSSPSTSTCFTTQMRSRTRAHGRIVGKLSRSCPPCRTTRGSTQGRDRLSARRAPRVFARGSPISSTDGGHLKWLILNLTSSRMPCCHDGRWNAGFTPGCCPTRAMPVARNSDTRFETGSRSPLPLILIRLGDPEDPSL